MEKIAIIGGGPHGCNIGWKLSKKGYKVVIYEEHKEVGIPIACTGLLSDSISGLYKVPKKTINLKLKKAAIYGTKEKVNLKIKPNLIVNRTSYDQSFRDKAIEAGCEIKYEKSFLEHKGKTLKFRDNTKTKADIIIGADGPSSKVAKSSGLFSRREHLVGIQARVKGNYDDKIHFYPNIGTYSWIVPEGKGIARIGVAARKNARETFEKFMGKKMKKIMNYQAGPIPLHHPLQKTQSENIYLVGDAAGQIKNTTGGGLIPGLIAGNILAKSIENNKNYHYAWKKKLGKELFLHYIMRNMFDKFDGKDYDGLIRKFQKQKINNILEEESRDHPSKIILKLAVREPSLAKYGMKLF